MFIPLSPRIMYAADKQISGGAFAIQSIVGIVSGLADAMSALSPIHTRVGTPLIVVLCKRRPVSQTCLRHQGKTQTLLLSLGLAFLFQPLPGSVTGCGARSS